jgi:hypothetical protein
MAGEVAETKEKAVEALSSGDGASEEIDQMAEIIISLRDFELESAGGAHTSDIIRNTRKLVDLADQVDKDHRAFREIISGFRQHLQEAQTGVQPPDPTILFYDDIEIISDEFEVGNNHRNDGEETFAKMLSIGGFSLTSYNNSPDKGRYLDTIAQAITQQINNSWSQKDIEISIRREGGSKLKLYMRDLTASDLEEVRRGLTRPSQRSYGFRWFFSFFVDVLADSETDSIEENILLFDDPAVYLHPEGKRDWLETVVKEISETEQVIYTAHSPYLIDKRRPTRVRIVEDKQDVGTTVHRDIFDPEADPDSLEPLRNALGINLGDSPFISRKTVLVEGPSDYYIITGVIEYFDKFEDRRHFEFDKISINPTNGADQMPHRASWLSAQDIDFAMILDSDN